MSTHRPIPTGILKHHVLQAMEALDGGAHHDFRPAQRWEVVHDRKRYAPKPVIGLAAGFALGKRLGPPDFASGEGKRQAVGYLRELGFRVERMR